MPESGPFGYGVFCFISLFAMIEPLGVMPVFTGMTANLLPTQQRTVALRATLTAYLTLLGFAVAGPFLFRFFGISIESLKIVGGIIIFIIGYEMLNARLSRTTHDEESSPEDSNDIAITPLGIPLLAGPGAMANVIVLWNGADTFGKQFAMLFGLTLVMVLTLVILLGARKVARFLGESGNKVLLRLMGLITMLIAVEFFFAGLKIKIQQMQAP
jgi:multiple antibiotic resistance protein